MPNYHVVYNYKTIKPAKGRFPLQVGYTLTSLVLPDFVANDSAALTYSDNIFGLVMGAAENLNTLLQIGTEPANFFQTVSAEDDEDLVSSYAYMDVGLTVRLTAGNMYLNEGSAAVMTPLRQVTLTNESTAYTLDNQQKISQDIESHLPILSPYGDYTVWDYMLPMNIIIKLHN